jgi:hypothetical protein
MKLSVILVDFNDAAHLGPCLTALTSELAGIDGEIIVVDNASTDGSQDLLSAGFPSVRVIANRDNVGFSRANNQAIRASGGELLMFLNTDTVPGPGSVRRLIGTLDADPGIGGCGPALIHPSGAHQVSFGRSVTFFGQLWQKAVLNPYYKRALPRRRSPLVTGWLSAACLLARRDAVDRAGGFDEDFFIYFEDIDLCRRIRAAGWRLVFEPGARVLHQGGATTSSRARSSRLEYRQSQLRYYAKHASRFSNGLLRWSLRISLAAAAVRGAFRDEDGRVLKLKYKTLLRKKSQ